MSEKELSEEKHPLIGKEFPVLSHGSIVLIDYMGSDSEIEQAARVSYGEGTRPVNETNVLLRYLKRHMHTSPFEQAEIKFKIKMPMDVNRQWIRHRTANVNEYSTRYSLPIDDTDTTDVWRLQSSNNKQGSDGELIEWPEDETGEFTWAKDTFDSPSDFLSETEEEAVRSCKMFYDTAVKFGIAREVARKNLTLSTYTELFWKCDLHNIMHFLMLRCDSHAQWEIRQYANLMAGIFQELFPLSYQAWYDYQFKSERMSRMEMQMLQEIYELAKQNYECDLAKDLATKYNLYKESDKSHREFEEFTSKFEQNYTDKGEFKIEF